MQKINLLDTKLIVKLREILSLPKNICIITHVNPDGDAIGSSLGLLNWLNINKHNVNVVIPSACPNYLQWMPGMNYVTNAKQDFEKAKQLLLNADIVFALDFNAVDRVEDLSTILAESKAFKILIDHHLYPEYFCDLTFSKIEVSSTCELLYQIIDLLGEKEKINKDSAACIYSGIITDTGSYSYSCNYPSTYHITAELIGKGIDGNRIHQLIYDTYSIERMKMLGYSINEKLKVLSDLKVAYISLTQDELNRFNYKNGDTEGIVNYALSVEGINVAALFTEREGKIRISFRSKGLFAVNNIAKEYFNGGGHKNAAGGTSFDSMESTLLKFESILPQFKEEIAKSLL